jgi:hypothetical protein
MIYEFRTYTLHPRTLPEVLKRWTDALEPRLKLSPLAAFWYTEIGRSIRSSTSGPTRIRLSGPRSAPTP